MLHFLTCKRFVLSSFIFFFNQLEQLAKKKEAQRALEEEEKSIKSKPLKPIKGEEVGVDLLRQKLVLQVPPLYFCV